MLPMTPLPPLAPSGQAFRLARLVKLHDHPAPLLIGEVAGFEALCVAEERAASVPGALVVLVALPKQMKDEPWA